MIFIDMDMPTCCYKCPLYDDKYDYPTCFFTNASKGYKFNPYSDRMSDCPLKSIEIGEDSFPERPNRNHKVYISNPEIDYYYQNR